MLSERWGIPLRLNGIGSMMTAFFTDDPVRDYDSAKRSDTDLYARFFHKMLDRGVYMAPSQFEAAFVSLAHSPEAVDEALHAAAVVFEEVAGAA